VVLLPLLGLLAGAGIAVALLQALSSGTPSAPAAAAEQRDDATVVLDPEDYIGRPVDEVAAQLAAYGLTVDRTIQDAPDAVPGMVTDVRPGGVELRAGDRVTVHFAAPTETGDADRGGSAVTGAAVDAEAVPTTSEAPATSSESRTTEAPTSTDAGEATDLPASPTESEPTETTEPETDPTTTSSSTPTTEPTTPPSTASSTATATPTS
jgi:serine/threonine-protein kinase